MCRFPLLKEYHVFNNSADSRPKLVAGSAEGYSGHVDGKLREARMNHPKGITVDDRGNIYVADTMNMAIRKISDSGRHLVILGIMFSPSPLVGSLCSSYGILG